VDVDIDAEMLRERFRAIASASSGVAAAPT